MSEFTYNVNGLVSDSEATFATVQRAFAEAMARPPIAADEVRALAAVAEAEGKPCVLPADLIARLEAEARAVLWDVEPVHAAEEREMHFCAARVRCVSVWRPAERLYDWVRRASWRPRATRKPSGWAIEGGWLDEAVPELPTASTTTTARVVMPNNASAEMYGALCDRYGSRDGTVSERVTWEWVAAGVPSTFDSLLRTIKSSPMPLADDADASSRIGPTQWHRSRTIERARPTLDVPRGWCDGLAAGFYAERTPGKAREWPVMVRAFRASMRRSDAAWAQERAEIVRAKGEGT